MDDARLIVDTDGAESDPESDAGKLWNRQSSGEEDAGTLYTLDGSLNSLPGPGIRKVPIGELTLRPARRKTNRRRWITISLGASFLCLGFVYSMLGPTLLTLSLQVGGASVGSMGSVFAARSFGYLLGSMAGGKAIDSTTNPRPLMVGVMLSVAVGSSLVPFCTEVATLGAMLWLQGLAMGVLDTCGNVLAVRVWREDVAPHMQFIHFGFAFGAFLAPMVARHLLMEDRTEAGAGLCELDVAAGGVFGNSTVEMKFTPEEHMGVMAWAWWTGSVFATVMAAAWTALIFVEIDMDPPPEADAAATDEYIGLPGIPRYQKQVIASATAFLCFYVGTEVAYGGLVYTFAVEACLLGVAAASDLTASYWGSFALGRLLAIPLSTWVSPGVMLGCSLGVAGSAVGLIVIFSDAVWAVWVGTFIFGLGMAASFPTAFTMLSEQVDVTGKIATLVIVGSAFGEMTIPWIIAERMDGRPEAFVGGIAAAVIGSVVVFTWFWVVGNRRRAVHWNEVTRRALLSQDVDAEAEEIVTVVPLELTQRIRSRNDVFSPS